MGLLHRLFGVGALKDVLTPQDPSGDIAKFEFLVQECENHIAEAQKAAIHAKHRNERKALIQHTKRLLEVKDVLTSTLITLRRTGHV